MGNRQNPSVVAIREILFFVKDLDHRICPLLVDSSRYPNIDKDVMKALDELGVIEF